MKPSVAGSPYLAREPSSFRINHVTMPMHLVEEQLINNASTSRFSEKYPDPYLP
jgi:hypothetical protein